MELIGSFGSKPVTRQKRRCVVMNRLRMEALLELGLDCEQIPVDLAKGDHQEPAFLEVNRAGAAMKSPHLLDLSGIGNPGVLPSRPDSGA